MVDSIDGLAFAREAAAEGTVLVRNDAILPLRAPASIAVIGHNAQHARTQGGGSATVVPERVVSPLEGIRAAFPQSDVTFALGAIVQEGLSELSPGSMVNPVTGGQGARVEMRGVDGDVIFAEDRLASALVYFGGAAPIADMYRFDFETDYTPVDSESVRIGFAAVGSGRVLVDGDLLTEAESHSDSTDHGAALLAPPVVSADVAFEAGVTRRIRVEFVPARGEDALRHPMSITIGTEPAALDAQRLIDDAAASAARAEVAVVVVGTNSAVESEGGRLPTTWPATQDDVPVIDVTPVDGVVRYDEGIHIGYRAWLLAGVQPAYPFGFGLGYTTWEVTEAATTGFVDGVAEVTVVLTNTGARHGKHVVQIYAERPDSDVERPVRWLVAHAVARLAPGETTRTVIEVRDRDLAYWSDGWQMESGEYTLRIGSSVVDLPLSVSVRL
ncbi:MAG: glycoside hydrolase family 3 C-terminal domain-containing protein [Intrasporangiaceae bacterium]|nr:glycoside hydrolase family 3 C-terminal domain-containing protein [Intrasporangiaceae bacterium]